MYFCRQRLKCGVAQTTVSSQMGTIGTGTKCLNGHWSWILIESKRNWLNNCNSRDQLDFLEVPYLLIVLLYNVSSIISSLLILYIADKETGKYFLSQVWYKFNREWNWIILDMKYTSVLGLLVTQKNLFFNGLIAVTGHLYFTCA